MAQSVKSYCLTQFGKDISMENSCFGHVPNSGGFFNVPCDELPKGLAFGPTLGTVCTLIWIHMAVIIFGNTVSSFFVILMPRTKRAKNKKN